MTTAEEETPRAMEPWEQHHAVINMPRYAYNAASILQKGKVGFLITCTFRREKSATKEALALLREFMKVTGPSIAVTPTPATNLADARTPPSVEQVNENSVKPQLSVGLSSTEEITGGKALSEDGISCSEITEIASGVGATPDELKQDVTNTLSMTKRTENGSEAEDLSRSEGAGDNKPTSGDHEFMLVKLATMGVIFISATQESPRSVLSIVSRIIKDVQGRSRPPPQWCHRMLPVQGTCATNREEVQGLVSRLVKDYLDNTSSVGEELIHYAVAFNKRGAEGRKMDQNQTDDSAGAPTFDRGECIRIVTAAVHQVTSNVKVDLTSPEMVIIVELVPVAGARSSLICAVSVLPGDLVISKPKLTVKPLASQSKKRKHH
ncbi:hypothetical protein Mapa_010755 [Marchantia paleacea]|nr:hypothetical protein Mapa_010755 [Marchantia paleacea]